MKQLSERLKAATDKIAEILGEEPRKDPLTEEEQQQLDALNQECEEIKAEQDALRAKLEAEQKHRKQLAAMQKYLDETPAPIVTTPTEPAGQALTRESETTAQQRASSQVTPVRRCGKLRAFQNEEHAYASGMWLLSALGNPTAPMTQRAVEWCKEHPELLAMSTTGITKGSAIVPDIFERTIIDLRESYGVFRQEAKVAPMDSDHHIIPRRTGGLTSYFVADNQEVTASDKAWDTVELIAKKQGVLATFSSELSEDSIISVADDLASEAAYAFAKKEDECGFLGDGTSTYGGIRGLITKVFQTSFACISEAASGNTAFSTLDLDDFEEMVGLLPQYAEAGAKWYISKIGWAASMLRLIEAAGGQTGAMIAGQMQKTFLGYPVVISQVMNTTTAAQTSTNGLCYLGNLQMAATLGNRRGVTVKVSGDRYLEYDQFGLLATERFALNVHDVGDTSTVGPIIGLATPSS
jgi:HK97 family phage major capsid protein